jgi:chromosome segregation ATPase
MEDLTIEILKQIRDELVTTRTTLSERIDETNQRIDRMGASLGERIDRTNQRLSTVEVTLLDLAEQQRFVVRHLSALTTRDRRLEDDMDALRARVDNIERRLG